MTPAQACRWILAPAFDLLPAEMRSSEAQTMLLAICLQESRLRHRIQLIGSSRRWWESLKGPARGFPQFERIGVRNAIEHPASRPHALSVLEALHYPDRVGSVHRAVAHNDVLALALARLLLWTDPRPLAALDADPQESWILYTDIWRPGKPKRETWDEHWYTATQEVTA